MRLSGVIFSTIIFFSALARAEEPSNSSPVAARLIVLTTHVSPEGQRIIQDQGHLGRDHEFTGYVFAYGFTNSDLREIRLNVDGSFREFSLQAPQPKLLALLDFLEKGWLKEIRIDESFTEEPFRSGSILHSSAAVEFVLSESGQNTFRRFLTDPSLNIRLDQMFVLKTQLENLPKLGERL
jgi:hypothetical protein